MRKFKVQILSAAQIDFEEAVDYYRQIDEKLAIRFVKATKTTVEDLRKMPMYQIKYDQIRIRIIQKFPYSIHFIVDEKNLLIRIYGIRFAPSDPKKWLRKRD